MKAAEVIAGTIGLDYESDRQFKDEYQYQPSRTTRPIFTDGTNYYAIGKKPPTDDCGKPWVPFKDQFWAQQKDTILWVSEMGAE